MSCEAKEMHMKKVHTCSIKSNMITPSTCASSTSLTVPVEKVDMAAISQSTLNGIWEKAEGLLKSAGSILEVSWINNKKARLVKS